MLPIAALVLVIGIILYHVFHAKDEVEKFSMVVTCNLSDETII